MRAVALPRMAGKTQRLLGWLISNRRHVLVVMSERERDRLIKLFNEEGSEPDEVNRIVSISDVVGYRTRGRWAEPIFGVDEVDLVLSQVLGGPVAVISFTPDDQL